MTKSEAVEKIKSAYEYELEKINPMDIAPIEKIALISSAGAIAISLTGSIISTEENEK